MKKLQWTLIIAALLLLVACSENPVAVDQHDDSEEELTVSLTLSADHIHTLSEVTFTVTVQDHHGAAVTNFETLQVERRLMGTDTWRGIDLIREGNAFVGTYMFTTSGEYEVRVVGQRQGQAEVAVLYEMAEPLHAARAHAEAGGYRVEYENFPGHLHEGDTATIKFWVKQLDKDASGDRPLITGLATEIHCTNPTGTTETHTGQEPETGIYQAEHTFDGAGEAHMAIHFTGTDGTETEADFHVSVVHKH